MPRPAPALDRLSTSGLAHLARVAAPALVLAPLGFVDEIAARLADAGVQDAVARRDPAPLYD